MHCSQAPFFVSFSHLFLYKSLQIWCLLGFILTSARTLTVYQRWSRPWRSPNPGIWSLKWALGLETPKMCAVFFLLLWACLWEDGNIAFKCVGDHEKLKKYLPNPVSFQVRNQPLGNKGNCQDHTGNAKVRIANHHTDLSYADPGKQVQRYFNILNKRNQTLEKWLYSQTERESIKCTWKVLSQKARFSKNADMSKGNRSQFEVTFTYPSGTMWASWMDTNGNGL